MEIMTVRPVLVNWSNPTNLLINTISGRLLYDCQDIIEHNAAYQKLILVSIDHNVEETIENGETYYDGRYNLRVFGTGNCYDIDSRKIIAMYEQIPESYVKQFVSEHNRSAVKDIEIEIEEVYQYHSSKEFYGNDADWVTCSKSQFDSIKEEILSCPMKILTKPKLTNDFITIVKTEQPQYTHADMLSFGQFCFSKVFCSGDKHSTFLQLLSAWTEQNKNE